MVEITFVEFLNNGLVRKPVKELRFFGMNGKCTQLKLILDGSPTIDVELQ